METNNAPKSTRGRKPSKWQLATPTRVVNKETGDPYQFANDKQAKAALAYARAFGWMPGDPRNV